MGYVVHRSATSGFAPSAGTAVANPTTATAVDDPATGTWYYRVTAVDGRPVDTREELVVVVRTHRPGDKVTFGYSRGGDDNEAELTLGGRVG